jgi:protein-S-isoprenylcysteine O-methyltransferase Ste14
MTLLTPGIPMLLNSLWSIFITIVASIAMHFVLIRSKEKVLKEIFEQKYGDYIIKAPIWLM